MLDALINGQMLAQRLAADQDEGAGILAWAIALGLAFLICFPAFLNPKRTHR